MPVHLGGHFVEACLLPPVAQEPPVVRIGRREVGVPAVVMLALEALVRRRLGDDGIHPSLDEVPIPVRVLEPHHVVVPDPVVAEVGCHRERTELGLGRMRVRVPGDVSVAVHLVATAEVGLDLPREVGLDLQQSAAAHGEAPDGSRGVPGAFRVASFRE